jgi:hypothetical protein
LRRPRNAYERHLARAVPGPWASARSRNTTIGFVIGGAAGFLTMGIAGPGSPLAEVALGVVPGPTTGVRDMYRQRRSRGWGAVRNRITGNGQA